MRRRPTTDTEGFTAKDAKDAKEARVNRRVVRRRTQRGPDSLMKSRVLKLFTALVLVLCLNMNISAQKQAKSLDCLDTAKTQSELNDCTGQDATQAERELNKNYQSILRKYAEQPIFVERMRIAQRAWLKFRDAQLEMRFPPSDLSGSAEPMCYALYKAELTQGRTQQLKPWLQGIEEGDVCAGSIKRPEELSNRK
jgi:uncharacterized protein YecT (DUF1311 family)